jgi:acyl-CoA synthetase (AMP-forming)/AMP-acid ligase II
VEDMICRHHEVAQAGVIGVPDAVWGESVRAFVVLKAGAPTTVDDLRAFLQERMADWKIPDSIHFERELPLGSTGKINRRLLRERALAIHGG